ACSNNSASIVVRERMSMPWACESSAAVGRRPVCKIVHGARDWRSRSIAAVEKVSVTRIVRVVLGVGVMVDLYRFARKAASAELNALSLSAETPKSRNDWYKISVAATM